MYPTSEEVRVRKTICKLRKSRGGSKISDLLNWLDGGSMRLNAATMNRSTGSGNAPTAFNLQGGG